MDGKAIKRAHPEGGGGRTSSNKRHEEEIGELLRKEREGPRERSKCSLPSKHDRRWPVVEKIILFSPAIW
jgi:hypothetical protein